MFESSVIVQTAVSAFNNAALAGPMFFWVALLMLPIFMAARIFGMDAVVRMSGIDLRRRDEYFVFWTCLLTFLWLIVIGGNYVVLRDATSTLPFVMAALLFVLAAFVMRACRDLAPNVLNRLRMGRYGALRMWGLIGLVGLLCGLHGAPGVWGFILPVVAIVCGAMCGISFRRNIRWVGFSGLIMFVVSTAILMQPEFFRFGQLGNLGPVHMIFLAMISAAAAALFALRNINQRGRIHHSAYVKLKYMARFVSLLALAMFVLTESVPVFLGMTAVLFAMFAMSVWHGRDLPEYLWVKMWAVLMFLFGVITIMPVVSVLGIVVWSSAPRGNGWRDFKFLL